MDVMVLKTQQYLNAMYGSNSGYKIIAEDGATGWSTIYALTRALQIELGITETADNFGTTTAQYFNAAYPNGIVQQSTSDTSSKRIYAIIQGALWCKGYSTGATGITEHFYSGTGNAVISLKKDAGLVSPNSTVTLNVMKALLSMNQYVTLYLQGGTDLIRSIQQNLNRQYENYIGLIPCDGLYGREMNKALIIVLQAIEGLSVSQATGNFGDTTKANCPILPDTTGSLSSNTITNATFLLKYALCCNGYSVDVSYSDWTAALTDTIKEFQSDLKLSVTGTANIDTWMSLLLSKGNPDRASAACDTRFEITAARAATLVGQGYKIVGRYLTGTDFKVLRDEEPQRILDNGLYFFPIFQESSTSISYFSAERAITDAASAVRAARKFKIPEGNIIYFAVDLDAQDTEITSYILPYFKTLSLNIDAAFKIGIYGTRNVCTQVINAGYAVTSFVSDMSTGYSGNMGYKMPANWNYDQFSEISIEDWAIDKDAYSGEYPPVTGLTQYSYIQPAKPATEGHVSVSAIIPKLQLLEELYIKYYTPLWEAAPDTVPYLSAAVLAKGVTNFLRSIKYNSTKWTLTLFQAIDEAFIQYVKDNNIALYNDLYYYISSDSDEALISDGSDGLIDLAHLAATVECYANASPAPDFWAGWGGDLATSMNNTSELLSANPDMSTQTAADSIVGNSTSSFNYADMCTDADAVKIAELINASTSTTNSFSEAVNNYYTSYVQNRYENYVTDIDCLPNLTALKAGILSKMSGFLADNILVDSLGNSPSDEVKEACCISFAQYVYKELA